MLPLILSILKIIGIILLVIIGVVIFLLLLVLFAPISYKADLVIPETVLSDDNDKSGGFDVRSIRLTAGFSWLLFVIRGGISYPENGEFTLRVFGFKIFPGSKKKSERKAAKEKDKKDTDNKVNKDKGKKEKDSIENDAECGSIETCNADSDAETPLSLNPDTYDDSSDFSDDTYEEDKSFWAVVWKIARTVKSFLTAPLNVLKKIAYTISRVCDRIGLIKSTLENDIFKRAWEKVKKKLGKVLKMIFPDKYNIDILLGTDDPANTGEVLGVYGALYPLHHGRISLNPDFDRKVVGLNSHFKGHITVFTLIYSAAVLYFDKDVKRTYLRFKKILRS